MYKGRLAVIKRHLPYWILCTLLFLLLSGESAPPVGVPGIPPNSCLIFANEFENAVTAKRIMNHAPWARIVRVTIIRWFHKPEGHALCVYALRNGDVWVYDINHGSVPLGTRSHDLKDVAARLHALDCHNHFARWLD